MLSIFRGELDCPDCRRQLELLIVSRHDERQHGLVVPARVLTRNRNGCALRIR